MKAHSQSIIINNIEQDGTVKHANNTFLKSTLNKSLYLPWSQYINHSKPMLGVRRSKTVAKIPHDGFALNIKSLGFHHKKESRFANKMLKGILIKNKSASHSKKPSMQLANRSFEGYTTKFQQTVSMLNKFANQSTFSSELIKAQNFKVLPIHSQHNSMSKTIYKSSTKKLRDHIVKIAMSDLNPKRRWLNYIIKVKNRGFSEVANMHKYIGL
jgi:hypothetical protein